MEKIKLSNKLKVSRIIHGHWRMVEWNMRTHEIAYFINQLLDIGISSFDHADIYGDFSCEKLFGDVLKLNRDLRNEIQLITKCGIQYPAPNFPDRKVNYYDYSYQHIIDSVDQSLENFGTDYIDLLLLHRPAPYYHPEEVAKAFSELYQKGKVLAFGVSNFNPRQFELLDSYIDQKLVTNQIEISAYQLEHFDNNNIDFLLQHHIPPMAWSPFSGGDLFKPVDPKGKRILKVVQLLSEKYNCSIDEIILSWLLQHPAQIMPILGTGKIDRIQLAVKALKLKLSVEDWYAIYSASKGENVP